MQTHMTHLQLGLRVFWSFQEYSVHRGFWGKLIMADSLSLWNWLQALTLGVLFGFHGNSEIQQFHSSNLINLEVHMLLLFFFFHILLLQGGVVFPWRFIIISVNRDLKVPLPLTFFNFGI